MASDMQSGISCQTKSLASSVSVLMPVHNGQAFVGEAIRSILQQTLPDFEFIIVDDASDDDTPKMLARVANDDHRVRVVRMPRKVGVAAALNVGLTLCSGDLVVRMDADDVSYPRRLALLVRHMIEHPEVTVCGSALRIYEHPWEVWRSPVSDAAIRAELIFRNAIYHPTAILRKSVVMSAGGYDENFNGAEDYALWLSLLVNPQARFANINSVLLRYRRHPSTDRTEYRRRQAAVAQLARQRCLQNLGLAPTSAEFAVHQRLSSPKIEIMRDDLPKIDAWLHRLEGVLQRSASNGERDLTKSLSQRWEVACARADGLSAPDAVRVYRNGRLRHSSQWIGGFRVGIEQAWKLVA